jgi:hypothetical protein
MVGFPRTSIEASMTFPGVIPAGFEITRVLALPLFREKEAARNKTPLTIDQVKLMVVVPFRPPSLTIICTAYGLFAAASKLTSPLIIPVPASIDNPTGKPEAPYTS